MRYLRCFRRRVACRPRGAFIVIRGSMPSPLRDSAESERRGSGFEFKIWFYSFTSEFFPRRSKWLRGLGSICGTGAAGARVSVGVERSDTQHCAEEFLGIAALNPTYRDAPYRSLVGAGHARESHAWRAPTRNPCVDLHIVPTLPRGNASTDAPAFGRGASRAALPRRSVGAIAQMRWA
ncbi:hypothetical protein D9M71_565440 [compost metagenome]